ncbi:MAG: hypothetical protein Q4C47_02020 [Planctomycetia bacterium]|nr:hypothetical protein [Planctomycetia bacterium]
MNRRFFLRGMTMGVIGGTGLMTTLAGCRGSGPLTLFNRKSLKQQRREAEYFDPFPLPESGPNPPGLRYNGMEIPAPEPVRAVADPANAFEPDMESETEMVVPSPPITTGY